MKESNDSEKFYQMDINSWYARYKDACPYCGADMEKFHPRQNLYPHFTGACKDKVLNESK